MDIDQKPPSSPRSLPSQETQADLCIYPGSPLSDSSDRSVEDFVKSSGEIRAEIQSLSSLCRKLMPGKDAKWKEVQRKLKEAGIGREGELTGEALCSAICEALRELIALRSDSDRLYTKFSELSAKHASLLQAFDSLNARLQSRKTRPALPQELEEKPLEIFRNFFGRDFRASSEKDKKAMAIVLVYENRLQSLKTRSESSSFERDAGLLRQLESALSISGEQLVLETVCKMQSVIQSLPQIESFVKEVSFIVKPELQHSGSLSPLVDSIVPTLHSWKERLNSLEKLHRTVSHCYKSVCDVGNIDALVVTKQRKTIAEDCEFTVRFSKLFEVTSRSDLRETLQQVFMFVHHTKTFLQNAKETLRIDPPCLSEVFAAIQAQLVETS